MSSSQPPRPLATHFVPRIFATWWPLAASWLLMGAELPAVSAAVARLPDPKIHLAAYGGIVFPLAMIIESPIIMLLSASTALSQDWASYRKIYRFMMVVSAALTVLHALIAFTPLYYLLVHTLFGPPAEIIEPGRVGLMIMLPWTWTIAYRRFHQGVLIRFGHSRTVGVGTIVRLSSNIVTLLVGYLLHLPGIVAAASAVAVGVTAEAVYAGLVVRPVLKNELRFAPRVEPPLTLRSFLAFYFPLVMISLISLLATPLVSAALSRMPQAIDSLAAWSPLTGLIFMFRSLGTAYNEVVVAMMDERGSFASLRRFAIAIAAATTLALLVFVSTPLARFWFDQVAALQGDLSNLAVLALWLALPLPLLSVLQSWYQGSIMYGRKTRGITEAVVLYLGSSVLILGGGVLWGQVVGLYVGMVGILTSQLAQTFWLWLRSRSVLRQVEQRDLQGMGL